jgi:hypothetical protein
MIYYFIHFQSDVQGPIRWLVGTCFHFCGLSMKVASPVWPTTSVFTIACSRDTLSLIDRVCVTGD